MLFLNICFIYKSTSRAQVETQEKKAYREVGLLPYIRSPKREILTFLAFQLADSSLCLVFRHSSTYGKFCCFKEVTDSVLLPINIEIVSQV